MSGIVALKMRILPSGLDVDLKNISEKVLKIMENLGAKNTSFSEESIAFGLNALIITTAWPEERSTDEVENLLNKLQGVSSSEVIDYRRAFG
ncbi:hypothetical protein J4447_00080 [Candidatus Pacearchaeota archaeon]|nr:hypothetical protein [Candidatus Pacearchaeota archaeon]